MSCEAENKDGHDSTGMGEKISDDLSSNSESRVLLVDDHPVNQKVRGLPGQDVYKTLHCTRPAVVFA